MRIRTFQVKLLNDYRLLINFNAGEKKIFDIKPYFKYNFYASLK